MSSTTATARLRGARRPLAVLAAAIAGLAVLGGSAGAALGAVGAAGEHRARVGHHQLDDGPRHGPRIGEPLR